MPSTINAIGDGYGAAIVVMAPAQIQPPLQAPAAAAEPQLPQPPAPAEPASSQQQPSTATNTTTAQQNARQQLQAQLDESLKNTGIKAEIENEKPGLMIVKFVQSDTGQLIYQTPPQGVLDLVAQVEEQLQAGQSPASGNIVDTAA